MVDITGTNLTFGNLQERGATDMIVIHHTGNPTDDDLSAAELHQSHLAQGWAGIGYHFVVRKNGTIERGRPVWAVGSHAYGENSHTIGVHVCGNFEIGTPNAEQIEKTAMLLATLCADYNIPIDRAHIVGHRELMATACPGRNLFAILDEIVGKANWYANEESGENGAKNKPVGGDRFTQSNNVESPEEKIWQFLKDKGLNDYAVAGIMGNLYAESGLKPTNLENYYEAKLGMTDDEYTAAVDNGSYGNFVYDKAGYGLAQWTYYSRKQNLFDFAKSCGASIGDIDMQLAYLWQEFNGYPAMMKTLKNAASVFEASNAVLLDFERPADQSRTMQEKRAAFAQEFYEEYALNNKITSADKAMLAEGGEEMRYNTIDELPDWAKPTIQKLIDKGLLNGDGATLDLSKDMLRLFVINDRAGVYGE